MEARVDQRSITYEPDDEALRELAALRPDWFDREVRLALLLARIDAKAAYVRASAATVAELGARMGYDGFRVMDLCGLGYALRALPDLEEALRSRRVTFAAAFQLGRVHRNSELLEEDDDWLVWAETKRLCDLKRLVRERFEVHRHQSKTVRPLTATVPDWVHEDFDRCRELATGKVGDSLTRGQVLTVVTTNYLKDHDPLWSKPGTRRTPPTDQRLFDRGVPAEVVRAIWERSGGLCEFGACRNSIQELCHLVPHAEGSPREVGDLVGGCAKHHKLHDLGWVEHRAWTTDGLPVFRVARTGEFLSPKPRPEERKRPELPEWLCKAIGVRVPKPPPGDDEPPETPPDAGVVRDRLGPSQPRSSQPRSSQPRSSQPRSSQPRSPQHRPFACGRRALPYERRTADDGSALVR